MRSFVSAQVPSYLQGTRASTQFQMRKICLKAIENLRHEEFCVSPYASQDTTLQTPANFFKRKVKESYE